MREAKAEEDEQLRLLAEIQNKAGEENDSVNKSREEMGEEVIVSEVTVFKMCVWRVGEGGGGINISRCYALVCSSFMQPVCEPALPFDRESLKQQMSDSSTEPSSPISVAGLVSGAQLKKSVSLSIDKLRMKSPHTRKDSNKSSTIAEDTGPSRQQAETVTITDKTSNAVDGVLSAAKQDDAQSPKGTKDPQLDANETTNGVEAYGAYHAEEIAIGGDTDSTPPMCMFEHELDAAGGEDVDGGNAVVSMSSSRATCAAAHSREEPLCDKHETTSTSTEPEPTPAALSNKTRSTKTGLSLRKGRKRKSDIDNSSFQEALCSDSQGPLTKRPRIEETEPKAEPKAPAITCNPRTNQTLDGTETDAVTKEQNVEPAVASVTDSKQTPETTKQGDVINRQKKIRSSISLSSETKPTTKKGELQGTKEQSTGSTTTNDVEIQLEDPATKDKDIVLATKSNDGNVHMVKHTHTSWLQPGKQTWAAGQNPSLCAPPGVPPAEHTPVLIQCFNEYFAKLAMAQSKVLWRIKWGKPVSNVNRAAASSLSAGRRTRRSRAVNIPYSEYALDLKSLAPSSRNKSSSPAAVPRKSPSKSPSKSPGFKGRQLISSDSDNDFEPHRTSDRRLQQRANSSHTKSDGSNVTVGTSVTTPSTSPLVRPRLSVRKKLPQQRQRAEKSESPFVDFERSESPDILPSHKPSRKSECETTASPTRSFSLPGQSLHTDANPQLQDDVMMMDLTSPSPPWPHSHSHSHGGHEAVGEGGDKNRNKTNRGEQNAAQSPHAHLDRDTDDSSDHDDHHPPATTSTLNSSAVSSGAWLDARKPPPPQKPKSKRAASRNTTQSKKKAAGGGAKGQRSTKRNTSAALRMKALIQRSDSDSEHSSLDGDQVASRSKGASSKIPQSSRHQTTDSDTSGMEFEDQGPVLVSLTNSGDQEGVASHALEG